MWINIKSALISVGIAVVLAISGYIIGVGNVYALDVHVLVNSGAMAFFIALVSLLKSTNTDSTGNFMGIKIIDKTPIDTLGSEK